MKKLLIISVALVVFFGCKKKEPVPQYTVTYHAYAKKPPYKIFYTTGFEGSQEEVISSNSFDKTVVLNEKINLNIFLQNIVRKHGDSVAVSVTWGQYIDENSTPLDSMWSNCRARVDMTYY